MSITSEYFFNNGLFNGVFFGVNTQDKTEHGFGETSVFSNGVWKTTIDRPAAEITIDLGPKINTTATQGEVALALSQAGALLTSGIRTQGVVWQFVPYFSQNPNAHPINTMLVRVDFDFHLETPWYCSDANGTISVYLFLFLDGNGHLQGRVDGDWFQYSGGGPFCTGAITSGLNAAMPGLRAKVQPILNQALAAAANIKFKLVYFLPGNGDKSLLPNTFVQDASQDMALGLLLA